MTGLSRIFSIILAALCLMLATAGALAQSPSGAAPIKLQSRAFSPPAGVDTALARRLSGQARALPQHVLVQLNHLPTEAEREALAQAGVTLLDYIPDRAWLASVNGPLDLTDAKYQLIRWAGPLLPADKTSPALRQEGVAPWALAADGQVTLQLLFFRDVSSEEAHQLIGQQQGAIQQAGSDGSYVVRFPDAGAVMALAAADIVQWVDNGPAPKRLRDVPPAGDDDDLSAQNDGARDRTKVNNLQTAQPGANGGGTRLGVWDGGADPNHPDFTGRLTVDPNHSDPANDHGTHVTGTMAGDGRNSANQGGAANQWRGIATAAQIYSYDNNVNGLNQDWFDSHQGAIQTDNVDLSQNSWGGNFTSATCDTHNVYSLDAQRMDQLVTGQAYGRAILANVAASNFRTGQSDDQNDPYPICNYSDAPPFTNYTSLSDLGSAKNIISVGATKKNVTDEMADFSSWGPTKDGRLKPDIVAPGEEIQSTFPGGGYGVQSGTSMATPHISGIAALVIQRYRTVFGKQAFQPSTIKAILLHTAKDLNDTATHVYYQPGPDYASGYGIADALAAYNIVTPSQVLEGTIANGETKTYTVTVTSPATPLKATLVWDDPAPALNAAPKLVNNLDLELVAPDGATTQLPWVLDPAQPAQPATTGVDSLNNVEQVYVPNPTAGVWTIRLKGTAIPQGAQTFSLVTDLAVNSVPPAPANLIYLPVMLKN